MGSGPWGNVELLTLTLSFPSNRKRYHPVVRQEINSTGLIAKVLSKRTEELISPMQEDFSFEALVSTRAGLLVVRVC